MISPKQENARMVARLLGVDEDEAVARLAQSVTITAHGGEGLRFSEELKAQLARTIEVRPEGRQAEMEIAVGGPALGNCPQTLYVLIDGASVQISATPSREAPQPLHALQRVIGACYAASVILGRLIPELPHVSAADPFIVKFSALGAMTDVLTVPIKLEDTVVVGAGAVGNAFLRAARHLSLSGSLTVCDPKNVGSGNPNRCLYFTSADEGKPKAVQLCTNAKADFPDLTLTPFIGPFAALREKQGRVKRVIIGTDSRPVRRSIENELPFEVIDASTTGASEVIVHSHGSPNYDACLGCIYPHTPDELGLAKDIASGLGVPLDLVVAGGLITREVAELIASKQPSVTAAEIEGKAFDTMFKALCAQQTLLAPNGEQVLAPFAFVSSLAGALQALELARFESGARFHDGLNYMFANAWAPPHALLRRRRPRLPKCEVCGNDQHEGVFKQIWADRLTA